jgi:hypothetical protein
MRCIGIPSPLRGRRLAGRSPYQGSRHFTGFVEEPFIFRYPRTGVIDTLFECRKEGDWICRFPCPRSRIFAIAVVARFESDGAEHNFGMFWR